MNEQEWLECTDSKKMLEFLRGKASDRKLRLFGCACCLRIWPLIVDERSKKAVEDADQYADGHLSENELDSALLAARQVYSELMRRLGCNENGGDVAIEFAAAAAAAICEKASLSGWEEGDRVSCIAKGFEHIATVSSDDASAGIEPMIKAQMMERNAHSHLLRDIFGNPFRPATINPAWLAWNDRTVPRIAQGIYDDRAFDRMPILADALMDAGCGNEDILNHCRSDSPHVKGCWVVDLLLGKE